MYRTTAFWIALGERALATFIEAFLGVLGVAAITGVTEIPWLGAANIAGLATFIMVGKGLVAGLTGNGSPGVGNAEVLNTERAN
jgi:hypothetical protein